MKIKYSCKYSCKITKHGKSRQNHGTWQKLQNHGITTVAENLGFRDLVIFYRRLMIVYDRYR